MTVGSEAGREVVAERVEDRVGEGDGWVLTEETIERKEFSAVVEREGE